MTKLWMTSILTMLILWPMAVGAEAIKIPKGYRITHQIITGDGLAKFDFEKDAVSLLISDQAKDGCMPSPQKVKDAYEGELRRMGIKIQKPDSVARYFFSIIVLGMAVGNLLVTM